MKPLTNNMCKNPTHLQINQLPRKIETDLSFCWKTDVLSAKEGLKRELLEIGCVEDGIYFQLIDYWFNIGDETK